MMLVPPESKNIWRLMFETAGLDDRVTIDVPHNLHYAALIAASGGESVELRFSNVCWFGFST